MAAPKSPGNALYLSEDEVDIDLEFVLHLKSRLSWKAYLRHHRTHGLIYYPLALWRAELAGVHRYSDPSCRDTIRRIMLPRSWEDQECLLDLTPAVILDQLNGAKFRISSPLPKHRYVRVGFVRTSASRSRYLLRRTATNCLMLQNFRNRVAVGIVLRNFQTLARWIVSIKVQTLVHRIRRSQI